MLVWSKKAPARNAPGLEWLFTKSHEFPGLVSTKLSNPKDNKNKSDALIDWTAPNLVSYTELKHAENNQVRPKVNPCKSHHFCLIWSPEVQVRTDGLLFMTRGGEARLECRCFHSPTLELTSLDPEEFISKIECTGWCERNGSRNLVSKQSFFTVFNQHFICYYQHQ